MQLFTVHPPKWGTSTMVQIPEYDSCIWTERYRGDGEFQLVTYNIEDTRIALHEGAIVGNTLSGTLMIVDSHEVSQSVEEPDKLTVKGYEFPLWLNNRSTYGTLAYPADSDLGFNLEQTGFPWYAAIWLAFSNIVRNNDELNNTTGIVKDLLPNVGVQVYVTSSSEVGTARTLYIEPGQKYDVIRKFLDEANLGIRVLRPGWYGKYKPTEVALSNTGVISEVTITDPDKLIIQIHYGVDRSFTTPFGPGAEVVFDVDRGDLKGATFLSSAKAFKNVAYVIAPIGGAEVSSPFAPGATAWTGMDRKVLLVQADNTVSFPGMSVAQTLTKIGQDALLEHNKTVVLDGEVSPHVSYAFGTDYELGTLVTFRSRYMSAAKMRCTEYIHSVDAEGYRAYPAFTFEN